MADTAFTGFAPVTSLLATDDFLAQRAAGGINFKASHLATFAAKNASDGTLAAPGFAFAAEQGTGLARLAANSASLIAGGVEHLRAVGGNIGIGTSAPAELMHLFRNGWALQRIQNSAGTMTVGVINGTGDAVVEATTAGKNLLLSAGGATRFLVEAGGHFRPVSDNLYNVGAPSTRVANYYGTNSAIVTSDEREKLWITITEDRRAKDRRIAYAILEELGWYQRLDSIEEKGEDDARWHFGARAQVVWSIVAAEGLCAPLIGEGAEQRPDPNWKGPPPPAWLCFDIWPEERSTVPVYSETLIGEDGKPLQISTREVVTREAGNRFGLRTDQLDLLLSWALHERDKEKDALIADLAERLARLEAA